MSSTYLKFRGICVLSRNISVLLETVHDLEKMIEVYQHPHDSTILHRKVNCVNDMWYIGQELM
jgi:hypothetical protein